MSTEIRSGHGPLRNFVSRQGLTVPAISEIQILDPISFLNRFVFWPLGRIVGMFYGFLLRGREGLSWGWFNLRVHPFALFFIESGGTVEAKGPLVIGYSVRQDVPFPGAQRAGLVVKKDGFFSAGGDTVLAIGSHVHVSQGAKVTVGRRTFLGYGSQIISRESISIGDDCAIGWGVTILDSPLHHLEGTRCSFPVVIKNRVWIGHSVSILQGTKIGEGAVIGAHSVVTHDIPPGALAVGNPARVIREGVRWAL